MRSLLEFFILLMDAMLFNICHRNIKMRVLLIYTLLFTTVIYLALSYARPRGESPLRMPYRFGKREESLLYWKSISWKNAEKLKEALREYLEGDPYYNKAKPNSDINNSVTPQTSNFLNKLNKLII